MSGTQKIRERNTLGNLCAMYWWLKYSMQKTVCKVQLFIELVGNALVCNILVCKALVCKALVCNAQVCNVLYAELYRVRG